MRLQELVSGRARPHADPSRGTAFVSVEAMIPLLDHADYVGYSILPSTRTARIWTAHIRDVLVRAAPVLLIDGVNPVVSHGCYVSELMTCPSQRQ